MANWSLLLAASEESLVNVYNLHLKSYIYRVFRHPYNYSRQEKIWKTYMTLKAYPLSDFGGLFHLWWKTATLTNTAMQFVARAKFANGGKLYSRNWSSPLEVKFAYGGKVRSPGQSSSLGAKLHLNDKVCPCGQSSSLGEKFTPEGSTIFWGVRSFPRRSCPAGYFPTDFSPLGLLSADIFSARSFPL